MLAVDTQKGKEALVKEEMIARRVAKYFKVEVKPYDEKTYPGDRKMYRYNLLVATCEIKAREFSFNEANSIKTYLISESKIKHGTVRSKRLKVPFWIFALLEKTNVILGFKIVDQFGHLLIDYNAKRTRTKETIHGGTAYRINAFIPFNDAIIIKD